MRSHPACCPAQEYPAPRHRDKQQSERDTAPGTYTAACISLKRASKECTGSTAPGGCWNVLELTPGPWLPACLIKALHPRPPSKCLATVLLPPLHAGRLHRTPRLPRARLRSFYRDRNQLAVSKGRRCTDSQSWRRKVLGQKAAGPEDWSE